ncbi:DMT family transporter [Salinisphaera aquimarina]|uniref:DMT family transporter n=1 Tax=Salinisphaera aquimarina TaxID=2094031 RepID=A0ABV7EN49_9GAMM
MAYASATTAPVTPVVARRALDMQGSLLMLVFCLALGLQQVAIKWVAADITPLAQIGIRSLLAALLVIAVAYMRGVRIADARAVFWPGVAVGIGFASEFCFVALGLGFTTASHMSVFLYTAPVFAALGLHFLVPGEQLTLRHWTGIAIAFTGIVCAMAPTGSSVGGPPVPDLIIGDLLGTMAGLGWAATTVVIRTTRLSEERPVLTLSYQLSIAAFALLTIAVLLGDMASIQITPAVIASMTFQTLGIAFGVLLLWFALLRRYLASRLGVFSFLSPVFGVAFGALLLGDPLTWNFIAGGVAIIAGVVLVSVPGKRRARETSRPRR